MHAEITILEDKLGICPVGEPWDPSLLNREPLTSVTLIRKSLAEQIDLMKGILPRLEGGAAYTLVAGSVLQAFGVSVDIDRAPITIQAHVSGED